MRRKGTRRKGKKVRRRKTYKKGGNPLRLEDVTSGMENKGIILEFLSRADAIDFSKTSPQAKINVQNYPFFRFHLERLGYTGNIAEWCEIFPQAVSISLAYRDDLTVSDFVALQKQGKVRLINLRDTNVTDEMLNLLPGIKWLDISRCNVTHAAFPNLQGIHTLHMWGCTQITDQAFQYLRGIHTLGMRGCTQITDQAFQYLKGIHTLDMWVCTQITDQAFQYLTGIHTLDMTRCDQITDQAVQYLRGIHTLQMWVCTQITDQAFQYLRGIHTLGIRGCTQITDQAFQYLKGIHTLDMQYCQQDTITPAGILSLGSIDTIDVRACSAEVQRAACSIAKKCFKSIKY